MSFLSRFFNSSKINSAINLTPISSYRQLLQHDEFDCYLFDCAKNQIIALQKALNHEKTESAGFEILLRDVFVLCYKAVPEWEDKAQDDYHYNTLKNLMDDPRYPELRKMTRFNGLLSALATVAFAQEYLKREQEMDQEQDELNEESIRRPRFLKKLKGTVATSLDEGQKHDYGLIEIERIIERQNDQLMHWGITLPMLPKDGEQEMRVAGLLLQNPEFLQFAEQVGQLRESLVNMGKSMLRKKGFRLKGICLGSNILEAVPSELALLGNSESEAIFYERALSGKLTLYDHSEKSERKRGPMVIVIDGSGSVRGDKGYMIRGIAAALVQLARFQKRPASVIIFGAKNEQREFVFDPFEETIAERLIEMATTFYGGDTAFWEPIELAFQRLSTQPFRQGDLLLVTDYIPSKEGSLSAFTERFAHAKSKLAFRYFSLFLPSDKWVNDLSWHELADYIIPLDTFFFQQGSSSTLYKLCKVL